MESTLVALIRSFIIPFTLTWESMILFFSSSASSKKVRESLSKASFYSESENMVRRGLRIALRSHARATFE